MMETRAGTSPMLRGGYDPGIAMKESEPQRAIPGRIEELERLAGELRHSVELLQDRLMPVLGPTLNGPEKGAEVPHPAPSCPLDEAVMHIAQAVDQANRGLCRIMGALQL